MTKETIIKIFDWLEENANKNGLLYFELFDETTIVGFFKKTNKQFASFYIKPILEIIEKNKKV